MTAAPIPIPRARIERICPCGRKDCCAQDYGSGLESTSLVHVLREQIARLKAAADRATPKEQP